MRNIQYYLSATLIAVMCLTACNPDTIDLTPIGNTEGEYFKNETQMEEAVFGIYQKLAFFYAFRGGQNNHLSPIWLLPSDDLTTSANYAQENFASLNGGNGQLSLFYDFSYQLIARANTVLQKIEENGDFAYVKQPELKDRHKGEALFLRSYMYFMLWNVYGTAPLVTERITNLANAYPENSKGTELLDQAIKDLAEAISLLPESWPTAMKGRVTKNAARGLRGKCLVFRGSVSGTKSDFTEAIADFNSINGVKLTANYNANFNSATENNEESLFEYQANSSPGNVNPFVGGAGGNDAFSVIGEIGAYFGMFNQKPSWIGSSYFYATPSIINAYESGDPRATYVLKPGVTTGANVIKYVKNTSYAAGGNGEGNGVTVNNPRILRYADVLLLKAEAIVRSDGSLEEAIGLVNRVRERARNSVESGSPSLVPANRSTTVTDKATVLDWIFKERRIELAFEEGHRWWDLRRRHIAREIDLNNWDFQSRLLNFKFEDRHIYFPLPEKEVVENPNMNQNQGY